MNDTPDPYNLTRFIEAQERSYAQALSEIRSGRKQSHWMWFVFPQIEGLGVSPIARLYAIKSVKEAEAYLAHPILGRRLIEIAGAVLSVEGLTAREIFGEPDDAKLRSCATLFASISPPGSVFHALLDRYFGGAPDDRTIGLLARLR